MSLSCELLARGMDPYKTPEPTPAIERAAKSWRLLLQIDSDKGLKMNWGGWAGCTSSSARSTPWPATSPRPLRSGRPSNFRVEQG